jgi:hypothetical protein
MTAGAAARTSARRPELARSTPGTGRLWWLAFEMMRDKVDGIIKLLVTY